MRLSKYLGVSESEFRVNGVYDAQNIPFDELYFIDVFTMKGTNIKEFEDSYTDFLEHFSLITDLLKKSKFKDDEFWQSAVQNLLFKEFQGIFFGFSKTVGKGNGIGKVFANQMTKAAHNIVKGGISDPEVFLFAPFLEEDIGFDRISDMVVSILFDSFARYTQRTCEELGIKKNIRNVKGRGGEVFKLPWYVNKSKGVSFPIFLCPKNFARRIPGNFDWEDPFDFYMNDGSYKRKINELIANQFGREKVAKKEIKKENLRNALMENPSVFKKVVEEISSTDSVKVTLQADAKLFAQFTSTQTNASLVDTIPKLVDYVLEKFKHQVEDKGYWKAFYKNGYHLNEEHIQAYFYFLAQSFCEAFGSEIYPEHHTGMGRVDFRIGITAIKPVLVEIKLSFHSQLYHGFEKQLPIYLKAEKAQKGIYLVVKMLESNEFFTKKKEKEKLEVLSIHTKRIDEIIEILSLKKHDGVIPCEQFIVDAIPKLSASKKMEIN